MVRRATFRLMVFFAVWVLPGVAASVSADALWDESEKLRSHYAAELDELAEWCAAEGLAEQARLTRRAQGARDPYKLHLPVLPRQAGPPKLPESSSPAAAQWHGRFYGLRREHAAALFGLARRAVRRRASLAYMLALESLHANPDNESVRRLFGYQKYRGRWQTFYEVRQLRSGKVWHEKFGWLPAAHVRRYEQGQRYHRGRWISAAEDAREHREIRSGWNVQTEHYTILTNHSIEAGVQLGQKLERLYRLWSQIFIRYYASEAHVVGLFDGRGRTAKIEPPKFSVVFFRNRDDYNRTLRRAVPNIGISVGFYSEGTATAYFFAGEDYADRTLYHEATHQLFHQSRPVAADVGRKANFWIVEGIAMYMESLRRQDDDYVLGGFEDQRMHAARVRLLRDGFYVPLEELTAYGMEKVHQDPRIATLYSQAAGLANFLVYYDGGRYRDALVAYLSAVYDGRDTPDSLAELTGTTYAELDRQYRAFIKSSIAGAKDDQ